MIQKQKKEKVVPTGKKSSEVQEYRKNNEFTKPRRWENLVKMHR
jgi:hypothetical protein